MLWKIISFLFIWLGGSSLAYGQQLPEHGGRTPTEMWLSVAVLIFGLTFMVAQAVVMVKKKDGWGPYSTRIAGLTLVIVAGLFLITAGYSQDQIAPMIGLLGTIAGYLLGKS
jgi:heme/copper-type cytochrome/quinol oxidase subunit 3